MSARNDSSSVSTRRAVNKLLETLRDQLQPGKSTREDKKYYDKIKKLKYRDIKDNWACEAVEGIPVENFGKYLDPDKAKKSFEDAMSSNGKHGGSDEFDLSENGQITMFSLECTVAKQKEKIDLAFATYNVSFKIDHEEEISSDKKAFSICEGKKNAFRKLYQEMLYNYVDKKCKSK